MTILTGGAGFIGSCFLTKLNSRGIDNIIVVDSHLDKNRKWHNLLGKCFNDYIPKERFLKLLENNRIPAAKHVVHMGACSSTLVSDRDYLMGNNYEYSKKICSWALKHNASFIYASSAATYGDGSLGYDDSDVNTMRLKPLNLYGLSKQLFDLWLLENNKHGKVTGLKFFNVFGPNEYHKAEMMSVICRCFNDIKNGLPMRLFKSYLKEYADGEQKRDFIYVKDAVEVMYYFYKNPKSRGIYNLGTGVARSWNDLARAIFSALNMQPKIEYIEMPPEIREKYQYFTQAKMDKLRSCGCRYKFTSLEEAVKDYVSYLMAKTYI
ncbi:MAG: ADP-glyceromanno-heptose 6-epimerase [Candidatus Omnitrophica bacterium]|nr:ADP-glyceromanno-heptose 6-epimerase [Candidatus Omnitrophota bacterium]MDD5771512.1 ADP-glyceromanno-heptose 6-epimerase [Candidatus Omnitrophota bacterium]